MYSTKVLAVVAAAIGPAGAAFQGFNYGATFTNGAIKQQQDYENEFNAAKALPGTNGAFNSARIYTTVQGDTPSLPIEAILAAIKTKTSLLLGLWASAGDFAFNNEIMALKSGIKQYCSQGYGDLVVGISVGSEDLYRNSPIGIKAGENPGLNPETLVGYIKKVRSAIENTCLSKAPVGHVDTWTAFVNGSNSDVIANLDWLGMDAYPYFENTKPNDISQGKELLDQAMSNTEGSAMGKPIWITETGWPVSGKDSGAAKASAKNAKTYWDEVGCPRFGQDNVWWYTLQDAAPDTPNPSFGLVQELNSKPFFDLSCKDASKDPTTSSVSSHSSSDSTSTRVSSSSSSASVPTTTTTSSTTTSTSESVSTSSSDTTSSSSVVTSTTSSAPTTTTSSSETTSTVSVPDVHITTTIPPTTTVIVTATSSGADSSPGSGGDGSSTTAPASSSPTDSSAAGQLASAGAGILALVAAIVAF